MNPPLHRDRQIRFTPHEFRVVKELNKNVILRSNWLQQIEVRISLNLETLKVND